MEYILGLLAGVLLVTLSGLGTGTMAWPIKRISDFNFEWFLLISMFCGIILIPWLVISIAGVSPVAVIRETGINPLLISNAFSIGWGVANVLYLICVIRIGAALSGAILSALGMSFGAIIPMLVKGSGAFAGAPSLFSQTGISILLGLAILLAGVFLMSRAGLGREAQLAGEDQQTRNTKASGSFRQAMPLIIVSGILSCGPSLAFVYSQGPVIDAVKSSGGHDIVANMAVWAFGMLGGGLVNTVYALWLMNRRKTWQHFFHRKSEIVYGLILGTQFILSFVLMGKGMVMLGVLGASVGFAIQQSMQIMGNQLVGWMGGEWNGVTGKPLRQMHFALLVIILGVVTLATNNFFTSGNSLTELF